MKEMEYTTEHKCEILDKSIYKGYQYAIVSRGRFPCCYIALEKGDRYYEVEYEDIDIYCHGGFTYSEHGLISTPFFTRIFGEEFWVIGWDYAHASDYNASFPYLLSKTCAKWTTQEMLDEVHDVIEQLNFRNTRELLYV